MADPSALDRLPVRDGLRGLRPYGAPQLDVAVRLNVNENPFAPPADVVESIAAAAARSAATANRYPDREAWDLRVALAEYLGRREGVRFGPERLWAANGSNEVMLHLLQAFGGPGRRALGFSPTYSMYPEYCRDTFTAYETAPREADFTIDHTVALAALGAHQPHIVLVASPNNPTGTALELGIIEALHEASDALIVVDEAYAEFRRPGTPSALSLIDRLPRLVVTRTMSKAFACAGLRVGYCVAAGGVVDAARLVRLPYHLSALTQNAAIAALGHADALLAGVDRLRHERDAMVVALGSRGFQVAESDANFVLFGRFVDRHAVWQGLLDHGVLIRETGPEGWLRVSIGTPDENAAFLAALTDVVPDPSTVAPEAGP
jgi:histidinol-phosphate aminotransferase